ncbi:Calcipressin [Penicillium riverlandense]|uniref:Calcipressin n=1 Tax=Penicillium riverlandense TaxID=1903569 RepID=UPI0025493B96|nr:Calcipressin [Penicillium riverlandense]KAJ5826234.1 Calcipressin [Penicillium riverlandense]
MGSHSPPTLLSSPSITTSRSSSRPSLSLDLSNLPPLSQPSPPSNTLLVTDLHDLHLFQPSALDTIRSQLTAVAPLNSFSPLPSLRRIVCSFHSNDDAVAARKMLEGNRLLGRVYPRIYFGEHTPIFSDEEARRPKLLEAPQPDKMFFISPPPSPPHGWVMRNEEPPNKEVHAHDLAHALSMLKTDHATQAPEPMAVDPATPVSISSDKRTGSWPPAGEQRRSRSSTLIYHPEDHGGSPGLPAVLVEDTTVVGDDDDEDVDMDLSPIDMSVKKMPPKTSRPPVELME